MTKEQFYKVAMPRPEMTEASYYRMNIYLRDSDSAYAQNESGEWRIPLREIVFGIYSSKEEAGKALHKEKETLSVFGDLHFALIERMPFNAQIPHRPMAWWLYDGNAVEIDHFVCSLHHEEDKRTLAGKYMGRTSDELRFKKGDIAEVVCYDRKAKKYYAQLAVINHTPGTIEEEWQYFNAHQESSGEYPFDGLYPNLGYFHDWSDDQYGYFTGAVPDNATTQNILPVALPLTKEVEQELTEANKRWNIALKYGNEHGINAIEFFGLMRGEITEEDIITTRKISQYIKEHPGKDLDEE